MSTSLIQAEETNSSTQSRQTPYPHIPWRPLTKDIFFNEAQPRGWVEIKVVQKGRALLFD